MKTFISVEEARALVAQRLPSPTREIVPLAKALGRVLLDEVISKEAIPPFDNSAMDGYAVRSEDLEASGGQLRVVGQVNAGDWPDTSVVQGSAVKIMTGAPMPDGADAVVPVEWTDGGRIEVHIDRGIAAGRNVRPAGQDMAVGQRMLSPGVRVGAGEISILATLGRVSVGVGRRPTVAVVSTGDELVSPDMVPGPGQIRNSNGPTLAAQVTLSGGEVLHEVHARDRATDIRNAIERAMEADLLVFSGGVSMGDLDLVGAELQAMGLSADFWKVRQRPGKPLLFGSLLGKPVFGLPGNPVSSSVCFQQYVRPALAAIQGAEQAHQERWTAILGSDFKKPPGLHVFARGVMYTLPDGRLMVEPSGLQGSNISTSLSRANCIVHLPAEWETAERGQIVEVEQF